GPQVTPQKPAEGWPARGHLFRLQCQHLVELERSVFALQLPGNLQAGLDLVLDMRVDRLRDEQGGPGPLDGGLDAGGDVDRVADGGELHAPRMAHLADHRLAEVDADAHAQLDAEMALKEPIKAAQAVAHAQAGPDGVEARLARRLAVEAE